MRSLIVLSDGFRSGVPALLLLLSLGWPLTAAASADALIDELRAASAPDLVDVYLQACRRFSQVPAADRARLGDVLEPVARRLFRQADRLPGDEACGIIAHRVASGETPSAILRRYAIGNGWLQVLNPTYDDRRLGAGQRLKVVDRSVGRGLTVVVSRRLYRCFVFAWHPSSEINLLLACLPVGIGTADRQTPMGRTQVTTMVRDPTWTHPDTKEVIPPDDPRNVLGGYWIGLDPGPDETFASIGFHGYTGAPVADWLERGGSRGCLRLRQQDIGDLFALVERGTVVRVVE